MPLLVSLGGCRTVHETTVEAEAPAVERPELPAPSGKIPRAIPPESLAQIPMSSTGIVLLKPLAPKVALENDESSGRMIDDEENAGAEADIVLIREPWPNPVARGGVTSAPIGIRMESIHFDYDSASPDFAARQALARYSEWMAQHPEVHLTLEGHCDERGSSEYNYNLAMARAWAVKELMIGLGVPEDRVFTISYGEEQPIAMGRTPEAYALNRRVEFRPFYPARDGHFLSSLKEESAAVRQNGESEIPPPQPQLDLGTEHVSWPPISE